MSESEALVRPAPPSPIGAAAPAALPAVPWRDPHTVSPEDLEAYIRRLEQSCLDHPESADLRTCLGMAYAVNLDVYKSMDALEEARLIDPQSFWAQLKYAELHYRLRALKKAEEEAIKAAELADNPFQLSIARRQLQEIRKAGYDAARNVEWTKPLTAPALALSVMLLVMFMVMLWK